MSTAYVFAALIVYAAMSFVAGMFCNRVADAKGYNGVAWMFGGFFFGLVALIAIAGMPVASQKERRVISTTPQASDEPMYTVDEMEESENIHTYIARMDAKKKESTPQEPRQS